MSSVDVNMLMRTHGLIEARSIGEQRSLGCPPAMLSRHDSRFQVQLVRVKMDRAQLMGISI